MIHLDSSAALALPVLARALEPFPVAVRTLDALRLATMDFLRGRGQAFEQVNYNVRLLAAARTLRPRPEALTRGAQITPRPPRGCASAIPTRR